MIEFSVNTFHSIERFLEIMMGFPSTGVVDQSTRDAIHKFLPILRRALEETRFSACLASLERFEHYITVDAWTYEQAKELSVELKGRIEDEMKTPIMLAVVDGPDKEFFRPAHLFGQKILDAFPSITYELDCAGKCLALDQYTASVFHLMRITEIGLNVVAASVNVKFGTNPTWQKILNDIRGEIDRRSKKSGWKKKHEEFYEGVLMSLTAIKTALRNPTMHVRGKYDDKEAEHIFALVRGLMQHLATRLRERVRNAPGGG
jgi:hypothetical protein